MPHRSSSRPNSNSNTSTAVIPVTARKRFFDQIIRHNRKVLPAEYQRFTNSGSFNLMKVWFDYQRVHYEVVIDQQISRLEIGLHFEDGPASTMAYLAILDSRILEIKERLGHQAELERWTQSWGRIYELHPLGDLTDGVSSMCAERLAAYISVLQPIIETSGVRHERE